MATRHNTANPNIQEVSAEELRENPTPEAGTNEKGETFGTEPPYVHNNRNNQASDPEFSDIETENTSGQTSDAKTTRAILKTQKTFTVVLPQNPLGQAQLPDGEVWVNGHPVQIKRGVPVSVPESVYMILVQSGMVPPQREKDYFHMPETPPQPLAK